MAKNPSQLASLARKQNDKRLNKKVLRSNLCRAIIQEQHGTPSTAKVLRIHRNPPDLQEPLINRTNLQERIIDHGHVILVDALTGEFIASIYTIHNDDNTNKHLRDKFDWAVQILYHHGLARKKCDINKAQQALGDAKSGEMYPTGSRGGTDKGKSGGPYVLNERTRSNPQLIKQDVDRMKLMPSIDKFISNLFSYLVLSQFKANLKIAEEYGISWASPTFFNTLDQSSCGSNLVITQDEFANESHQDPDASGCAIGLFCLMEHDSGRVIHPEATSPSAPYRINGAYFHLDNYNTKIRLSHHPKVVVWNTKMHHHSSHSQTVNSSGKRVTPKQANLTNFGSSIQVSKTIVDRIRGMRKKKSGMSDESWNAFKIMPYVIRPRQVKSTKTFFHGSEEILSVSISIFQRDLLSDVPLKNIIQLQSMVIRRHHIESVVSISDLIHPSLAI
ncbi:uncharacterized protein MELLADRAFT_114445 [Melampsora larici-populina 98AG31]|uniref:Tet-like 2OG-Fe(II) oxygenase domain-containing protein n=1 Tax=Melampsora larici-populina (strain 98AG31 / pathotype 3-4-7) TaxID=747676 RepID=F4SDI1_MELLP|nr:uncharacterized protein MELLADRAFT_114445 [Melampsora larici-populina 98AG31]EGF97295.1 hypothetical protein MELLADRAFT_114445 [Melampsora larici-populina 98AG31]